MSILAGPGSAWFGVNPNLKIDAATMFPDGFTYIFQKDMVYKWLPSDNYVKQYPKGKIAPGFPKKIKDVFKGVPDNLDTAFRWPRDGRTYFFKGKYFWHWDETDQTAKGLFSIQEWKNVCNMYKCRTKNGPCTHW